MSDDLPNRQTIRLTGYDYTQNGYYFITICTHEKQHMFGNILVGAGHAPPDSKKYMQLNELGEIVNSVLKLLPKHYPVKIDISQIMPNHIHLILVLTRDLKNNISGGIKNVSGGACPAPTIGNIVGSFKSESTKRIHKSLGNPKKQIFQRNYYEHIIRSEREFKQIHYYIQTHPQNWENDKNNIGGIYDY